jgi:hypothetical protein
MTNVDLNGGPVTGAELKKLREHLGEAIGRPLSVADMASFAGWRPPTAPTPSAAGK